MTTHVVLVPGMCSVGDVVYRDLVKQLAASLPEETIHVVNLPSVDGITTKADLDPNGLAADIATVRSFIEPLVANGDSVVIIGHSYGGTPSLYAAEGLWSKHREGNGGVRKAGLLSSSLPLPGGSIGGDREEWNKKNGLPSDPIPELEQCGKETFIIPKGFESFWMNDLPDHTELRSSLRPSPLSTLLTPTPNATVKQWDIAYLATVDLDLAMSERFQKHLADRAKEQGASVKYDTIKSGHFVQVGRKAEVAEWALGLVRGG